MINWTEWHSQYDDETSTLHRRLLAVKNELRSIIKNSSKKNPVVLNICSGQGRDILEIMVEDSLSLPVYLIDKNQEVLDHAAAYVKEHNLKDVVILNADAGILSTYIDNEIPMADIIIISGVLGRISEQEVLSLPHNFRMLLNPGGSVLWLRSSLVVNIFENIQTSFIKENYEKVSFIKSENIDDFWNIGINTLSKDSLPIDKDKNIVLFNYMEPPL